MCGLGLCGYHISLCAMRQREKKTCIIFERGRERKVGERANLDLIFVHLSAVNPLSIFVLIFNNRSAYFFLLSVAINDWNRIWIRSGQLIQFRFFEPFCVSFYFKHGAAV